MDLLNKAANIIKQKEDKSRFENSVINFLEMLQSPVSTDEQIKLALDSVLAIARLEANAEQSSSPQQTIITHQHSSIQETLRRLKAKLSLA